MSYDRVKLSRALARQGYTKAAAEMLHDFDVTAYTLLESWDMYVAEDRKGRQVLWIKEGRRYRRTVLR